ncbi:hypothetical protein DAEQUDRAFT_183133 [Daedalea quercina L-15889]|uniref:Uncharacterized protein n=1 Tax=Daedalea quercina L-15889 TaxID=1314783 RepID=A0A165RFK5_9APHY|nr:hypothetical protein DAEQUDRAFT_183133 [Daedalea quercina L-15889]
MVHTSVPVHRGWVGSLCARWSVGPTSDPNTGGVVQFSPGFRARAMGRWASPRCKDPSRVVLRRSIFRGIRAPSCLRGRVAAHRAPRARLLSPTKPPRLLLQWPGCTESRGIWDAEHSPVVAASARVLPSTTLATFSNAISLRALVRRADDPVRIDRERRAMTSADPACRGTRRARTAAKGPSDGSSAPAAPCRSPSPPQIKSEPRKLRARDGVTWSKYKLASISGQSSRPFCAEITVQREVEASEGCQGTRKYVRCASPRFAQISRKTELNLLVRVGGGGGGAAHSVQRWRTRAVICPAPYGTQSRGEGAHCRATQPRQNVDRSGRIGQKAYGEIKRYKRRGERTSGGKRSVSAIS